MTAWAVSYAWYLLLPDSAQARINKEYSFCFIKDPGRARGCRVMECSLTLIMTEISRNICLASDRRLVTGHHWSCANIDLDTWGRSKSPSYQESSQPRSNCSPCPAWTLSPGQWLRLIFVCLVLRESRMLAKMPNIAAESYGRATFNKLDFLGIRNVSVFQVSFNLTVIPIDGAVLHAIVTLGQVFLSLTFHPGSAMDKHYSTQS